MLGRFLDASAAPRPILTALFPIAARHSGLAAPELEVLVGHDTTMPPDPSALAAHNSNHMLGHFTRRQPDAGVQARVKLRVFLNQSRFNQSRFA
jgi:hypothetical protein